MTERGAPAWAGAAESGSMLAMRAMAWFYRTCGRRLSVALLAPIVAYFFVRRGAARRASRAYLATLAAFAGDRAGLAGPPTWRHVLRHFHHFAVNILDRMIVWGGAFDRFAMDHEGSELLFALARERRGAILLGAHLGSFDMPRVLAGRYGLVLNVVMFTAHAERITAFFERLDSGSTVRVVHLDPGSVRTAFAVKACLDRGELVAILGDRVTPDGREHAVTTRFLGRPARFPSSPYLLAGVLGCPLLASVCVRTGDARYETVVRELWPGGRVARPERDRVARALLERYVRLLEEYCVRVPYEWFNLYDFWKDAPAPTSVVPAARAAS